jgi:hypothetical protein
MRCETGSKMPPSPARRMRALLKTWVRTGKRAAFEIEIGADLRPLQLQSTSACVANM